MRKKRNWYYHKTIEDLVGFLVSEGETVLEVGSGTGDLLNFVSPRRGLGIDISPKMVELAKRNYPACEWLVMDAEEMKLGERFDYIILSDVLGYFSDIEKVFHNLKNVSHERTRIVINYYNYGWEPFLRLAELLGLKFRQPLQHWLSEKDIENLLYLAGFEVIKRGKK